MVELGSTAAEAPRGTAAPTLSGHAGGDADFLAAMGRRVREARERRGLARRALSRAAGVSERYLAQLEAGEGNASVLLLRNVARALGLPLTEFIDAPENPVEQRLIRRFLERLPEHRLEDVVFRLMREMVTLPTSFGHMSLEISRRIFREVTTVP